ncbi:hypothetical protein OS965_02320 [Streptomyces sp. H27-G5]|uniref:hypothetical protein n=1 Tax=Streptomyces sp. H27-G5 TaxID=2996698 RepID=UPI00226FF539|nr:hypothetical protein [Streptomyces sp. H27-G5]MCY0917011.1 hypothetical protein [Streptomyces sp. H27-G5]
MAAHQPLGDIAPNTPIYSLEFALGNARRVLAEQQAANIHDERAMISAAVALEITLRELIVSLDAKSAA